MGGADRLTSFAAELAAAHARLTARLADLRAALADGGPVLPATDLADHCLAFCATVRAHHTAEDGGLFAALLADRPDLAGRVDRLAEDHGLVAGVLARVEALVARAADRDRGVLVRELDGLAAVLASHFAFEERVVAGWEPAQRRVGWLGDTLHPDAVPRPTVRVLLVDGADRVLLFRSRTEEDRPFWFPAGGGIEPGETPEQAAVRELTEETGWASPELGAHVGDRRHVVTWDGVWWDVRERWYLARVDRLDVDTSGFTAEEAAADLRWRWWSVDDLRATDDFLVPGDLADLLAGILRDGPPDRPLTLGI